MQAAVVKPKSESRKAPEKTEESAQSTRAAVKDAGSGMGMPIWLQHKSSKGSLPLDEGGNQRTEQPKCAACASGGGICPACAREDEKKLQKKENAQADGSRPNPSTHALARGGVETANEPLPHLDRLQSSFGRYNLTGIKARVGGPAADANSAMGSLAYTLGDRVGFQSGPDVRLAAHEAAHTVQQREGVQLKDGVGQPGDGYEKQADLVAEAVDRGESAEPILDQHPVGDGNGVAEANNSAAGVGSGSAGTAVQHRLSTSATRLFEPMILTTSAPTSSGEGSGSVSGSTPAADAVSATSGGAAELASPEAGAPASTAATATTGSSATSAASGGFSSASSTEASTPAESHSGGRSPSTAPASSMDAATSTPNQTDGSGLMSLAPPSFSSGGGPTSVAPGPVSSGLGGPTSAPPAATPSGSGPSSVATAPATSDSSAGGAVNAVCYHEPIEEPVDEPEQEPPEPAPTQSQEHIQPDLPQANESDICPVGAAIQAQASTSAPAASASTAPSGPPAVETVALAATGSLGSSSPARPAAAPMAAVSTNASPLDDSIAQAEAGRDNAVTSYEASDATVRALGPRIDALSADARFLPEPNGNTEGQAQRQAAEARLSAFFAQTAERLRASMALATDAIPDQLGATAQGIIGTIGALIEQQKGQVSARASEARAQAIADAESARAQVNSEHAAYVATVEGQTRSALDALNAAHDETLGTVGEIETESLGTVNEIYSSSYDAHVALGPEYASRAEARGEEYAAIYGTCKINRKDSFFAGHLTDRRAEAQINAARETAGGYRNSLIETANDQAAQAMRGRRHDRCGIIEAARSARTSMDGRLANLVSSLESGQQDAIAQAATTRDGLLASIDSGLESTLAALGVREHDDRQSLDDTGYLQQVAVEQTAHASASAVLDAVRQAVENVESTLSGVRDTLAETPAPDRAQTSQIVARASAGINQGINALMVSVENGAAEAEARLVEAENGGIAALNGDGQASLEHLSAQSEAFSSQMQALADGATTTFGTMRDQYTERAQQMADSGAEGFAQAVDGLQQSCDTMLDSIEATLGQSELRLGQEFQHQVAALDNEQTGIPKQAREAASREQPAWKGVLAVILIIAIIIVVALVIGPAVIGAVGAAAAALGASAGVATAVGAIVGGAIVGALSSGAMTLVQNFATGQRWDAGLWQAMAIGALTGAVGGAIGLGVNAGVNALIGTGGRFVLSQGAQFVVRASVNIASDALMNIGQQLAMTGHINWSEFAQGMAMSLVLHGSRRVQAFQARVTAGSARMTAAGVSRVTGSSAPTSAGGRASRFAAHAQEQANLSTEEAARPLDWTPPPARQSTSSAGPSVAAPESPTTLKPMGASTHPEVTPATRPTATRPVTEASTPARPASTEAAPTPTTEATPPARPAEAGPVTEATVPTRAAETESVAATNDADAAHAPQPDGEGSVRRTETEIEAAAARTEEGPGVGSDLERPANSLTDAELAETTTRSSRIGEEDHHVAFRRRGDHIECEVCSAGCANIKQSMERVIADERTTPEVRERISALRDRVAAVEQGIENATLSHADVIRNSGEIANAFHEIGTQNPHVGEVLNGGPIVEGAALPFQDTFEMVNGQRRVRVDNLGVEVGERQVVRDVASYEPNRVVAEDGTVSYQIRDPLTGEVSSFPEGTTVLYVLRDRATGAVVKAGETTFGTAQSGATGGALARFEHYQRAAGRLGLGLELEITPLRLPEGGRANPYERALQGRLEGEGHIMPWDYFPNQRLGRVGRGTPFENPIRSDLRDQEYFYANEGTEAGYLVPPGGGRVVTQAQRQQAAVAQLRQNNPAITQAEIARRMNVPKQTVSGWFNNPNWLAGLADAISQLSGR